MIESYCYGDDGYSMQQDSYHAMQNEYHNGNNSSIRMMRPSPQYSKQNMMMHSESYGSGLHDGFHGNNKYQQSGFTSQNMHQSTGYPGSGSGSNGYYMGPTSVGGKPTSHYSMSNACHASHSGGGAGGFNSMMMSSTEYDGYNKVRPGPMRMQHASGMGYENGRYGTSGHHYNQSINCMPTPGGHSSEWISKDLDYE